MTGPALRLRELRLYRLNIPMRVRFEHAAATREVADPVVVGIAARAPYAHITGYGETLARPYVTGETPTSVVSDIGAHFVPRLEDFAPATFAEALEIIEALPTEIDGRLVNAARAAVELALLDLSCRAFGRRPAEIAGWLGLPGFGPPGCLKTARYSGIIVGSSQRKLQMLLRLQRWAGLRDFKFKVAVDGWEQRLRWAHAVLEPALRKQRATLRVDANAGWTLADAAENLEFLESHGVSVLEQPLPEAHDADLPYLAEQSHIHLMVDESLLTLSDAQQIIAGGGVRVLNVRLAKNGGLMPALRIARAALVAGLDVQLGCLVGETSILTAAGVAFLEACPRVRFVEGGFGTFLLKTDVTRRSLRIGLGGRVRRLKGPGLGVEVDAERLTALAVDRPQVVTL